MESRRHRYRGCGARVVGWTYSGKASQQDEKLGKLSFPTSCDPKVQAEFGRGVAMIHSYWFLVARRTFEGVLKQDPNCAIAYWGVAIDLLNNVFVAPPQRADADAAWAALEKAREIGAKTPRERDWIEALSAYYRDHGKTPVNVRLANYNKAMEQLVERYPDDYEAKVFYASPCRRRRHPATRPMPISSSQQPFSTSFISKSAAPGREPFHDPRLRLRTDCREGPSRGAAIRRCRAGGAARAAHAFAHLFDAGTVGRFDRVERFGDCDPA